LDLDIKGFFDNIDHGLLMRAVRKHTDTKWLLLYIAVAKSSGAGRGWHNLQPWKRITTRFCDQSASGQPVFANKY
jgi:retron-type reverse transcriptase